eukprot:scaffold222859_cov18-Tisochrysis_lutea.AAC.1
MNRAPIYCSISTIRQVDMDAKGPAAHFLFRYRSKSLQAKIQLCNRYPWGPEALAAAKREDKRGASI